MLADQNVLRKKQHDCDYALPHDIFDAQYMMFHMRKKDAQQALCKCCDKSSVDRRGLSSSRTA